MKKLSVLFAALFIGIIAAHADTKTINWIVDGSVYDTTICSAGDDITPPTPPAKYGYTFQGWVSYTPIEYIESTGTQYIDTGVVLTNDVEFTARVGTSATNVLGITAGVGLIVWQAGQYFNFRYPQRTGEETDSTNIPYTLNTLYDVGYNINKTTFSVDGQTVTKTGTIYDRGLIIKTGTMDITAYLKIWDNDTLVRDMIPVLDLNGIACMYDLVTNKFFYNAGTGDFIAGPVIDE